MRIGGRLSKADIQRSAKHPLILPGKQHVVQLLIQHHEISHFGTEYVLLAIRQRLSIVECQSSRLVEDKWYVNEEKQDHS